MTPRRLMAVLAHPDDESLGCGGSLARYAAEGAETYVVTATRGDGGRYRGIPLSGEGHPGGESLGRMREAELRAAAAVLGVREVSILGYADGALDKVDPQEVIARVAELIRRHRPHVIITFGADGGYGHPDHIAISQFATAALLRAAGSATGPDGLAPHAVSKLYYFAWSRPMWSAYEAAFKKLTSTVDGVERQAEPWPEWAISADVDTRPYWSTVWKAVSCHASQIAAYERLKDLTPEHHEGLWGRQCFYRVLSLVNGGRQRERDLFEGIET